MNFSEKKHFIIGKPKHNTLLFHENGNNPFLDQIKMTCYELGCQIKPEFFTKNFFI